jgi:hypothetical protein
MLRLPTTVRSVPLVNSWYAHLFLISPATFGLFTKNFHLPLLNSFIDSPEQHRASARAPELRGSPFADYNGSVDDIRQFCERTLEKCAPQLALADAITEAYKTVLNALR